MKKLVKIAALAFAVVMAFTLMACQTDIVGEYELEKISSKVGSATTVEFIIADMDDEEIEGLFGEESMMLFKSLEITSDKFIADSEEMSYRRDGKNIILLDDEGEDYTGEVDEDGFGMTFSIKVDGKKIVMTMTIVSPDYSAESFNDEEPGAGNEEPGAGDEEPGAGDEEPGAGDEEPGDGDEEEVETITTVVTMTFAKK